MLKYLQPWFSSLIDREAPMGLQRFLDLIFAINNEFNYQYHVKIPLSKLQSIMMIKLDLENSNVWVEAQKKD